MKPEFLIGKLLYFLISVLFLSETAAQQLRFDSHNYEIGMPKRIFLFQRVKSQLVLELHYCTSLHKEASHFPKETHWKRNNEKVKFEIYFNHSDFSWLLYVSTISKKQKFLRLFFPVLICSIGKEL